MLQMRRNHAHLIDAYMSSIKEEASHLKLANRELQVCSMLPTLDLNPACRARSEALLVGRCTATSAEALASMGAACGMASPLCTPPTSTPWSWTMRSNAGCVSGPPSGSHQACAGKVTPGTMAESLAQPLRFIGLMRS